MFYDYYTLKFYLLINDLFTSKYKKFVLLFFIINEKRNN